MENNDETVEIKGVDFPIRMSILRELIKILCNEETYTFASEMLRRELDSQREAIRVERERLYRETEARQKEVEQRNEYKSE